MLFDQDSSRKSFDRVILVDGHDALQDDWPTIQSLVNEMDRTTSPFDAVFERLFLCVQARK